MQITIITHTTPLSAPTVITVRIAPKKEMLALEFGKSQARLEILSFDDLNKSQEKEWKQDPTCRSRKNSKKL